MMPVLYVIAGPNGAGKSSLSVVLLPDGVRSFDGDLELQNLKTNFPDTDEAQLLSHVIDVLFPAAKERAIGENKDFAYETNFATEQVMDTVQSFQDKGYQTELIYIGLPSLDQSISRVKLRVLEGGHQVSMENIRHNYKVGLENTAKYMDRFDRVLILENPMTNKISIPKMLAIYQRGKLVQQAKDLPSWAKKITEPKSVLISKKKKRSSKGRKL
jgi:predicted ABC-type ATPase